MDVLSLLRAIGEHQWLLVSALVIGMVVRLLKSGGPIPWTVPARVRPWLALGLGIVSGVLAAVATGRSWRDAMLEGLGSAVAAILGHEVLIESVRGGKEMPLPGDLPPPGATVLVLLTLVLVPTFGCSHLRAGVGVPYAASTGAAGPSGAAASPEECGRWDDAQLAWGAVAGGGAALAGAGGLSAVTTDDKNVRTGLAIGSAVAGALAIGAAYLSNHYAARWSDRCAAPPQIVKPTTTEKRP